MKAFHNDQSIKDKYLKRVKDHQEADEIIKGLYWENGKGCAVGCTIHSSDHLAYETELGIPEWLARLEDTIFEGLPNERSKSWPYEFLSSIQPGVDLNKVKVPFIIFVLESSITSMKSCKYDEEKFPNVKKAIDKSESAIKEMIRCWKEGVEDKSDAWSSARSARSAARFAAWSAARSADESAAFEKFADKLLDLMRSLTK